MGLRVQDYERINSAFNNFAFVKSPKIILNLTFVSQNLNTSILHFLLNTNKPQGFYMLALHAPGAGMLLAPMVPPVALIPNTYKLSLGITGFTGFMMNDPRLTNSSLIQEQHDLQQNYTQALIDAFSNYDNFYTRFQISQLEYYKKTITPTTFKILNIACVASIGLGAIALIFKFG